MNKQTAAPAIRQDSPQIAVINRLFREFTENLGVATGALAPGRRALLHEETLGAGTYGTVSLETSPVSGKSFAVKRPIGVSWSRAFDDHFVVTSP